MKTYQDGLEVVDDDEPELKFVERSCYADPEYAKLRAELLEAEVGLRDQVERVAELRRKLPVDTVVDDAEFEFDALRFRCEVDEMRRLVNLEVFHPAFGMPPRSLATSRCLLRWTTPWARTAQSGGSGGSTTSMKKPRTPWI